MKIGQIDTPKVAVIAIVVAVLAGLGAWYAASGQGGGISEQKFNELENKYSDLESKYKELAGGDYLSYGEYSPSLKMPPSDYKTTLHVHAWAGHDHKGFWDKGEYAFHKMYPNVKIEWSFMADEASALAKYQQTPNFADVVIMYTDPPGTKRWVDGGYLEPLNPNLLPLFDELYPSLMSLEEMYYNGKLYALPFNYGYTSLIVNPKKLKELGIPKEDWNNQSLLFKDYGGKLKDQVWLYDSAVEVLTIAASAAGIPKDDVWNMTEEQRGKVKEKLKKLSPKVGSYWTGWEPGYTALSSGKAAVCLSWLDVYSHTKRGPDGKWGTADDNPVKFMWPEDGYLFSWTGLHGITVDPQKNPKKYKVAHAFLTATMSARAGAEFIDYWNYGPANRNSVKMAESTEVVKDLHLDDPSWALKRSTIGHYMKDYKKFQEFYMDWRTA